MGAVWPRAVAPMGSISRPQARKLTLLWSFFVAIAILRSTFLVTNYECFTSALRTLRISLHAGLAYHERSAIVKQARLRLLADVSRLSPTLSAVRRWERGWFQLGVVMLFAAIAVGIV